MSIYGNFALKNVNESSYYEIKEPNLLFMEFDMIAKDLKCDVLETCFLNESFNDSYITEGTIWEGIKSIFKRIKEAVLHAIEKIKEIFHSVWDKIRGKKHKETVKAYIAEKKTEPVGSHPGRALKQLPAVVDGRQLPATTNSDKQLPAVNSKQLPSIASEPFRGWIDFSKVAKILAFVNSSKMYDSFGIKNIIKELDKINTFNYNAGAITAFEENLKNIFPDCILDAGDKFFGSDLTLQQFGEKCGSFQKDFRNKFGINITLQQFKSNLKTYVYENLYMGYGGDGEKEYNTINNILKESLKELDRMSRKELKWMQDAAQNNMQYELVNTYKRAVNALASTFANMISGIKTAYSLQTRMAAAEVRQIGAIMTYFG